MAQVVTAAKVEKWSREGRLALLLILGMIPIRIIAATSFPLLASEAYYWLWGQFPTLGNFDHPPMVGWMSAIFFGWVRQSPLAARSGPIVLGALTTWVVYLLGRDLFGRRRVGLHAALLFSLVPIFSAGCVLIQPDNSLMLFTALTWLFFWRAANSDSGPAAWLPAGVCAGLALLSKFHAWVLLPPLYLFLFLSPSHRRQLRRSGPWIAIGVALLVLSPNLIWNSLHGWVTYTFQAHRSGLAESRPGPFHLMVYLIGPLATLSPLVYFAVLAAAWKGWRQWLREHDPEILFLLIAGAPLPLFFLLLSPLVSISLHWAAMGYIPLAILFAGLVDRGQMLSRRYWNYTIGSCSAIVLLILFTPGIIRALPDRPVLPFYKKEANIGRLKAELIDWRDLGTELRGFYEQMDNQKPTFLMTPDFHLAAQLSFYTGLPDRFQILNESKEHNFEIWEDLQGNWVGARAVILVPAKLYSPRLDETSKEKRAILKSIQSQFGYCADGPTLPLFGSDGHGDRETPRLQYRIILAYNYKGESENDEDRGGRDQRLTSAENRVEVAARPAANQSPMTTRSFHLKDTKRSLSAVARAILLTLHD